MKGDRHDRITPVVEVLDESSIKVLLTKRRDRFPAAQSGFRLPPDKLPWHKSQVLSAQVMTASSQLNYSSYQFVPEFSVQTD